MDTLTRNLLFASAGGGFGDPEFVGYREALGSSITLSPPDGTTDSDLLVALVVDSGTSDFGSVSGYTKRPFATDSGFRICFYYKLPGVTASSFSISGLAAAFGSVTLLSFRRSGSPTFSFLANSGSPFSTGVSPSISSSIGGIDVFFGATSNSPSQGSLIVDGTTSSNGFAAAFKKSNSSTTGTCTWTGGEDNVAATITFA